MNGRRALSAASGAAGFNEFAVAKVCALSVRGSRYQRRSSGDGVLNLCGNDRDFATQEFGGAPCQFFSKLCEEEIAGFGNLSSDDDDFRIERVNKTGDRRAERCD